MGLLASHQLVTNPSSNMTKTLTKPEAQMDTHPSTIAELAAHFLKGESWVKEAKNDLRETYWWMTDKLFDETGSLTAEGFQKFQELFDRTSNTKITEVKGKRRSQRCKPPFTRKTYRLYVWTEHSKFPPDADLEGLTGVVTDPATDYPERREIVVQEVDAIVLDPVAELEQDTQNTISELKLQGQRSASQMRGAIGTLRAALKAQIKRELAPVVHEAIAEAYAEATEAVQAELPQDVQPTKVSRRKKS